MAITVLPPLSAPRRQPCCVTDSFGRLLAFDAEWSNITHNYTGVSTIERYDQALADWTIVSHDIDGVQFPAFGIDSSDRFYAAGGQIVPAGTFSAATEIFDATSGGWTSVASLELPLIQPFSWMDVSGTLWLLGGLTNSTGFLNPDLNGLMSNARKYSGGGWTTLSTDTFVGAGFAPNNFGVVDSLNRAYFISGVPIATMQRYDPTLDLWAAMASPPSGANLGNIAITPDDHIYCVGTSLSSLDITTNLWTSLTPPPGTWTNSTAYLGYHAATNALYLIGGNAGAFFLTTILRYDILTDSWSDTSDTLSVPRFCRINANVVQDGKGFYIVGGEDDNGDGTTAVEYFVPTPASRGFGFGIGARIGGALAGAGRSYAQIIGAMF